jgi:hypothetical protein
MQPTCPTCGQTLEPGKHVNRYQLQQAAARAAFGDIAGYDQPTDDQEDNDDDNR